MLHEQRTWIVLSLCALRHCHLQGILPSQCLHFKTLSAYFLVLLWICVFSFLSRSSEVNLLFFSLSLPFPKASARPTVHWNFSQSQTGRIVKEKKHILISIHMASHLLNNNLAQKVSFHQYIHSQKQAHIFVRCLYILS